MKSQETSRNPAAALQKPQARVLIIRSAANRSRTEPTCWVHTPTVLCCDRIITREPSPDPALATRFRSGAACPELRQDVRGGLGKHQDRSSAVRQSMTTPCIILFNPLTGRLASVLCAVVHAN